VEFVRDATADDVAICSDLYRLCITESDGTRGAEMFAVRESLPEPIEPHFEAALADPNSFVYVGGIDDSVLGFALAHFETVRSGANHVVIDAIFVEQEARAVGIGELLMEKVVEWSREKRASSVDAFALPGDRDTKNFFEMSGFTARLLTMHHKIVS
jgi:L-amino acid N-acyltransferase YncA